MAVFGGGISGYVERMIFNAFFGAGSISRPTNIYIGLATASPVDICNFGDPVTYGASSLTDTSSPFVDQSDVLLDLTGAFVISDTGKHGVVQSNTASVITLTGAWVGGAPASGEAFYANLYHEPSGNGYARVAKTNTVVAPPRSWLGINLPVTEQAGVLQKLSPDQAVNFPPATGSGWGTVAYALITDSATLNAGHLLAAQALVVSVPVLAGAAPSIVAGGMTIGLR